MDRCFACPLSGANKGRESTREYSKACPQGDGVSLEETALCPGAKRPSLEAGKRGLKKGLKEKKRTVVLFEDETILTEKPPLRASWALIGEQAKVAISGNRGKRVLYGVLNSRTGKLITVMKEKWNQQEFQGFLRKVRSSFRGWKIVMFLDRGSIHKAKLSEGLAKELKIELRWLPVACPELNPLEGLWRHLKLDALSNRVAKTMADLTGQALDYLASLSRHQCLQKAGILSNNFWLDT